MRHGRERQGTSVEKKNTPPRCAQCRSRQSPTLAGLRGDKRLDEGVGGLGVERQRVTQALQLRRLVQERLLEAVAAGVEVLLDGVEGHVQHGTLLRRQVLLRFLGYVLKEDREAFGVRFAPRW